VHVKSMNPGWKLRSVFLVQDPRARLAAIKLNGKYIDKGGFLRSNRIIVRQNPAKFGQDCKQDNRAISCFYGVQCPYKLSNFCRPNILEFHCVPSCTPRSVNIKSWFTVFEVHLHSYRRFSIYRVI